MGAGGSDEVDRLVPAPSAATPPNTVVVVTLTITFVMVVKPTLL